MLDLQVLKTVLTDSVLHPAGVGLCCLLIHAGFYEHFRKKAVFLIGSLSHLAAYIGQTNEAVLIPFNKSACLQRCNGMGDAR